MDQPRLCEVLSTRGRVRAMLEDMPDECEDVRGCLRGQGVEVWLKADAAAAFDELHANPSEAVTGDQMRADLAKRHTERAKDRRRA